MDQLIWNGLFVGSFYALVALGYSMVYGIIRLLNFAHGDVYMVGAFLGYAGLTLMSPLGAMALPIVLVLVMLASGLLGVGVERLAYRPLRSAPRLTVLITAVGVSFSLEYGVRLIAGASPRVYPIRIDGEEVKAVLVGVAVLLMFGLHTFVMRSRAGRAMRAIAADPKAAHLVGVDVNRVITQTFFLGSMLAGAAGVMAGAYYGRIDFLMGFVIGLKAFTAAVIGGIGNLPGAMLGGLALGLIESFGTHFTGGLWRDVFAFGCLIAFLVVRPTGILGERTAVRM
ncbi:MAG TPA: branched-chain amino acid ABC transporter permease [Micromonosporaceae bacterium]|nr:branched-chain amino acid ABC transporter permease [Micromonosporaceae bacterium]